MIEGQLISCESKEDYHHWGRYPKSGDFLSLRDNDYFEGDFYVEMCICISTEKGYSRAAPCKITYLHQGAVHSFYLSACEVFIWNFD